MRRKGHRLEALQPQLGQHKLRPVLTQVAKEHQPQPIAGRHYLETHDLIAGIGPPCL